MKAHEIVTKLQAIKDSQGFKDMAESDTITVESEGSEYRLPAYEIDNMIKKLSKVNEDKPNFATYTTGVNKRSKELQTVYAHLLTLPTELLKKELRKPTGAGVQVSIGIGEIYNDFLREIISKKTNTKKTTVMKAEKQNNGLRLVKYSDKAYAVFGETRPIKDKLKAIGGKFNPFLKENGEKSPGWIFSAKKLPELESLVN